MSLMGRNYGGQCPSHPLTVRDKAVLIAVPVSVILAIALLVF